MRPECCYTLTAKGSNKVGSTMPLESIVWAYRLLWTVPKLAEWQQHLCYHSEPAVERTFENTTQYTKLSPIEPVVPDTQLSATFPWPMGETTKGTCLYGHTGVQSPP
jgi:hypothetical protein